mmetsp:Transcript_51638/g.159147  ORF Transcript_51638/g.159147 Transcript_51638/m.159147 type:complete len:228 (+) Transcript_51638:250-933(+)
MAFSKTTPEPPSHAKPTLHPTMVFQAMIGRAPVRSVTALPVTPSNRLPSRKHWPSSATLTPSPPSNTLPVTKSSDPAVTRTAACALNAMTFSSTAQRPRLDATTPAVCACVIQFRRSTGMDSPGGDNADDPGDLLLSFVAARGVAGFPFTAGRRPVDVWLMPAAPVTSTFAWRLLAISFFSKTPSPPSATCSPAPWLRLRWLARIVGWAPVSTRTPSVRLPSTMFSR